MGNGVIDTFRLMGIADKVEKIQKIKSKNGIPSSETISISNTITIKVNFSSFTISINGNDWLKIDSGLFSLTRSMFSGGSLGIIKGPFRFLTSDKSVQKQEYVNKIFTEIEDNVTRLSNEYKNRSNKNWKT